MSQREARVASAASPRLAGSSACASSWSSRPESRPKVSNLALLLERQRNVARPMPVVPPATRMRWPAIGSWGNFLSFISRQRWLDTSVPHPQHGSNCRNCGGICALLNDGDGSSRAGGADPLAMARSSAVHAAAVVSEIPGK